MSDDAPYGRILLKLSGEALMGQQDFGHDAEMMRRIAEDIQTVHAQGIEIGLVIGGGNIFRGVSGANQGIERASADFMGMLATVINAIALQNVLEGMGTPTRVLSAIPMRTVCEPYIRRRAISHMEKGRIVICAAGTGNPYFTTDTAAALRAAELDCDALLKATQVDGVYSSDPATDSDAKRYECLSFHDVLAGDLKIMDASAISLARENKIPILVFSVHNSGALDDVLHHRGRFTVINEQGKVEGG
ncbi:MAG: UMP kinase [Alphaproteobacteria bacterium]|nr:UMP kinase [Alphaproteobacteria bacterium]